MKNHNVFGPLVLRVSLGVVLIAHSLYLKMMVFGLSGTAGYFESIGLPAFMAYVVFLVEAVTGVMLIIGYKAKIASLIVAPILLGATLVHVPNGWLFTAENGGWEYPLFLTLVAIAVALMGSGGYSLDERQSIATALD
ncbi:MAG: DoxX family protein [Cellvibrionaceae bacterium]